MLMTLGDDRAVRATYVAGHLAYDRERKPDPFSRPSPPEGQRPVGAAQQSR